VRPVEGIAADRARRFDCDLLVTGFGLMPSLELPRLIGATLVYARRRGGWTVARDADFQCSVPGVHVVGDGAGIGGAELAMVEGRIAARAVARRLGRDADDAALRRRWARLDRARNALEAAFAPPASFARLIAPDTVVCRCEDVTLGDLERRRAEQAIGAAQLKATTRLSMGRCQGRNCLPTLAALLSGEAEGGDPATIALPRPRPPLRPIPIGDLLHETLPPPDLPEDPHRPRARPS